MVEINGRLSPTGPRALSADDTRHIASELIGTNKHALGDLREKGSCDVSYSLPGASRFRVNVFMQRGSCAIVMRVIPSKVPSFAELNLPEELQKIVGLRNGIVLVTGPTGSGKSSTLAAVIDLINKQQSFHILTIEDPIEFLHPHQNCIVHQRELHSDTTSFALALRAALRQAPKVILVGEMRDRETIEIAMEAAETGHLVMSTLHTIDASKTVERIIGVFPLAEQHGIRNRLAKSFRYIISQRLIPRKDGSLITKLVWPMPPTPGTCVWSWPTFRRPQRYSAKSLLNDRFARLRVRNLIIFLAIVRSPEDLRDDSKEAHPVCGSRYFFHFNCSLFRGRPVPRHLRAQRSRQDARWNHVARRHLSPES